MYKFSCLQWLISICETCFMFTKSLYISVFYFIPCIPVISRDTIYVLHNWRLMYYEVLFFNPTNFKVVKSRKFVLFFGKYLFILQIFYSHILLWSTNLIQLMFHVNNITSPRSVWILHTKKKEFFFQKYLNSNWLEQY